MRTLAAPPTLPAVPEPPAPPAWRDRLRERWPELVITLGALVVYAWGLSKNGYGNPYYAAAVRSMTHSWKNFIYGAVDPGGWITTDKPPLALWLGSLSARVLGYSSWSLLMPSVLCGVASIWLLMSAVRRAWGAWAGRIAGIVLALTPVFIAVSRVNNPDATLVLCMVAAVYATQRAISDERPAWMIVAGLCCGLAFLAKLLVVGLVMPGAFAAYLVAGSGGWWRRLRDLTFAGLAFVAVGASWVVLVDLTPASSRPYIGMTTNNTAQNLVFGAHGFGVLTGNESFGVPGVGKGFGGSALTGMLAHLPGLGGQPGIARMFNAGIGDQLMWLAVPAILALVGGVVLALRRRLTRPEAGSLVLWGGYGLVGYLVLSYTHGVFHDYYVSAFAPAIAALVGIGVAMARRAGRLGVVWVLVALVGTAIVEVVFLRRVDAHAALRVAVPVGLAVVAAFLLLAVFLLPTRFVRVGFRVALTAGLAVALVAPAVWTLSAVRHSEDAAYASAGPPLKGTARGTSSTGGQASAIPGGIGPGGGLASAELDWLRLQRKQERWLVAVRSDLTAEDPIIAGDSVLPMGGFYGTDPAMTRDKLATLVADKELRFVDTGGFTLGDTNQIGQLVAQACTHVDPAAWNGTAPGTLYDCAGRHDAIRSVKLSAATPPGSGTASAGGIKLGPAAAVQRLVTCLKNHGWNPTPNPDLASPTVRKALSACASLIPAAAPGSRTTP